MDQHILKEGAQYKICPRCGKNVAASNLRCDNINCRIDLSMVPVRIYHEEPPTYTLECILCGEKTTAGHTACPSCGETMLRPIIVPEKKNNYYAELFRYDENGKRISAGKRLIITDGMVVGRTLPMNEKLFYDKWSQALLDNYNVISSENIRFSIEGESLFVQKISESKSDIKIFSKNNTERIISNCEKNELKIGDILRLGRGNNLHRLIDITICDNPDITNNNQLENTPTINKTVIEPNIETEIERKPGRLTLLEKKLQEQEEQFSELNSKFSDIMTILDNIPINSLNRNNGESDDDYSARLDSILNKIDSSISQDRMDEIIHEFLIIKTAGEEQSDYYNEYKVVASNRQLSQYFYHVAIVEQLCCKCLSVDSNNNNGPIVEDFSSAAYAFGRLFEEYICSEVLYILHHSDNEDEFQAEFEKKSNNPEGNNTRIEQGFIMYYLLYDKKDKNKNRIKNMLKAAGHNENDYKLFKELKDALYKLADATKVRNKGSHSNSSGNAGILLNEKYLEKNDAIGISQKYYMTEKEKIFSKRPLEIIHKYYCDVKRKNEK